MSLSYCTLASGSSGNASLIRAGEDAVLLDCGLTGKKLWAAMEELTLDPSHIRAILVTHEHSDHCKGVGVAARKLGVPVYATKGTWKGMLRRVEPLQREQMKRVIPGDPFAVGRLSIDAFPLSHDAWEPCGYRFSDGVHSVGFLTDTGVVLPEALERIRQCTGLVLESNYDPEMLQRGSYPAFLKARIEGVLGHMSNQDCACLMEELAGEKTRHVLLAHLSQDNNHPELALREMKARMSGAVGLEISVAPRYRSHPLICFD